MRTLLCALALALALAAAAGAGCTTNARECGSGRFCPDELVCLENVGCCADPEWLAQLEGGADAIAPAPDGGVVLDGGETDAGEPRAPLCGTAR